MEPYENLRNLLIDPEKARAELCKRYFYDFFCEFWSTIETVPLVANWHIKYICDALQKVYEAWERGESQDDVLINVPPGSSKSTICTQIFPAWLWTRNASIRVISSSYSADLSTIHAVKSRDILKSDKYQRFYQGHIVFKTDTDGKTHYKNTSNGERFVTSTAGTVRGMHGDFIINDDPLNNIGAAGSDSASLKNAATFIRETLSSRKTNKERTVTIMIMQRLHDMDPAGIWIKEKEGELNHICLPATLSKHVNPGELSQYYAAVDTDGELVYYMDPVRLGPNACRKAKKDLGSYGYAGQFMQTPTPEGGGIWEQWFIPVPDHLFPQPEDMDGYGTDWDTAFTAKQANDATAYCVSGSIRERIYLDNIGYFRKEFPAMIRTMAEFPAPHYIEQKASGQSAKQTLVDNKINAIEVPVVGGDKVARTRMATPTAEAGRTYVRFSLLDKLYNDEEQGLLRFPNGAHDDVNDAVVQALQRHNQPKYQVGVW